MQTDKLYKRFNNAQDKINDGVFLYGGGVNGEWCKDYLERNGIRVIAFIDSNPSLAGSVIDGTPVIRYTDYVENESYREHLILVTSKHHAGEILGTYIENEGMISFDAWFLLGHKDEYDGLKFEDEKSYAVLGKIMDCMLDSDESVLRDVAENNQYFPFAPFFNTGTETYVDLGAYTGDTIEKFLFAQNGGYKKIYAFEPGKLQFDATCKRVDRLVGEWALNRDSICLLNAGVGEKSTLAGMSQGASLLSMKISDAPDDGRDAVRIYSLDDYFGTDKDVTFIKADIEGMEYGALLGAEKLIKRCRPKMALSVYHKPDDLLRIYRLLSEWNLGYRFALRHHSSLLMDTTLYCW